MDLLSQLLMDLNREYLECIDYVPVSVLGDTSTHETFYTPLPQEYPAWQALFFPFQTYTWIGFGVVTIIFILFLGSIYTSQEFSYGKVFLWVMETLTGRGSI